MSRETKTSSKVVGGGDLGNKIDRQSVEGKSRKEQQQSNDVEGGGGHRQSRVALNGWTDPDPVITVAL